MARKGAKRTKTARKAGAKKKSTARAAAPKKAKIEKPIVKKVRQATRPKNANTLSYTQSEFLENIRGYCGLAKRSQARELWNDISLFIADSLKRGYRVPLVGLGKMYVRRTKPRMGRNPATGEVIHISAKKRVRFTPAKSLKDNVL